MGKTFKPHRHILPFLIFLGVLVMGVRLVDFWNVMASGEIFHPVKISEAATGKEMPEISPPTLGKQSAEKTGEAAKASEGDKPTSSTQRSPVLKRDDEGGSVESELVKQLTERRDQLDQRAKALDSRETLIKVAEQRVDQKIKEMETLRAQLQTMVNQASSAQQAQIDNLVKIYETMKPKEAAKIFEALDMSVLLGVIQKMKPARTAAVMAEMNPEKAKEITVALTKQDQLPQIK